MAHGRKSGVVHGVKCELSGKVPFRTYVATLKAIRRLPNPEGEPYRCRGCGWYHRTSLTNEEYNRRQAWVLA